MSTILRNNSLRQTQITICIDVLLFHNSKQMQVWSPLATFEIIYLFFIVQSTVEFIIGQQSPRNMTKARKDRDHPSDSTCLPSYCNSFLRIKFHKKISLQMIVKPQVFLWNLISLCQKWLTKVVIVLQSHHCFPKQCTCTQLRKKKGLLHHNRKEA